MNVTKVAFNFLDYVYCRLTAALDNKISRLWYNYYFLGEVLIDKTSFIILVIKKVPIKQSANIL